jgi:hypothetical protein
MIRSKNRSTHEIVLFEDNSLFNYCRSIRKEEDFKAVKGMPGMYYKVYRSNIAMGKCHSK